MRKVRWVFAMCAVVAALGFLAAVPADFARAEEKGKAEEIKPEVREARQKGGDKVEDIGTAYALIDIARRRDKENPAALITAVEILTAAGPGDKYTTTVEGGGKVAPEENYYDQLRGLLKEAAGLPGGKSEACVALSKEAAEKIDTSEKLTKGGRGTAAGHSSATIIIEAGKTVTVKRLMMFGTGCVATVTKKVNDGVPLKLTVTDPSGKVYASAGGASMTVKWTVPKNVPDTVYSINVTNPHSVDVAATVTTN